MKLLLGWQLAALQLLAGDLYLLPDSFLAAVGERLLVRVQDGRNFPHSEREPVLADSAIYTAKAAYNLLSPQHELNALILHGNLKDRGTAVLAVESKDHRNFAKALVVVEVPDQNSMRQLGTALELVPDSNPLLGDNSFHLLHRRMPLAGCVFELLAVSGSAVSGKTNVEGKATVRITKSGRYLLRAAHEDLSASLTFEVR